ncbi:P-loop ATPase, Sll1717 family [Sphingobacterium multivorum]|uniref:P-loop ATPase, Sll1717 family n=1 Tax=Sphingobacterium multivorum TaxID=28454 RepID=UPI003DA1FF8E
MNPVGIKFTDENIRKIFGAYDGEGEDITRLSQYYLKTDTYESTKANLPVKILVGSKGVGKSALFRIALKEGREQGRLCILVKPDDIAEIGEKHDSLMISIRQWKYGLTKTIIRRVVEEMGLYIDEDVKIDPIQFGGKVLRLLKDVIRQFKEKGQEPNEKLSNLDNVSKENPIEVYLDDLDRGWQNRKEGLVMISALINSIRDMSAENEGLVFKLALRTDVYNAVRTADESSDKFEGLVTHYSYKIHEIYVLLIKRILTFNSEIFNERELLDMSQSRTAHYLNTVFEQKFNGNGHWENKPMHKVLLSLIRNRPRDLVKLCTMAAKEAYRANSKIIRSSHIEAVLTEYSKSIINDTIAEYKSELPSIDRLIYGMKPSRRGKTAADAFYFTTNDLKEKLFRLSQLGEFRFASGTVGKPQDLITFLFKIGFLTATKTRKDGGILRKSYEDASHLSSSYMDFGFDWEVHMGYRWAIQPETLDDIWAKL